MKQTCLYCDDIQTQESLMIKLCDLPASTVFLFREQTYKGRCVVAYKEHAVELYELKGEELLAYMEDVNRVARAMKQLFNPAKINYGAYSDKLPHLHMHLAPKYVDGPDYGGVFVMNPQKVYLTDEEYQKMVEDLKGALGVI
ncbi:diadenosine tetraphosphate (Ap4A) HIT family hydrolase [Parabacteroides sp. PFB2-12]|uniref:HIT family protein n=1 Tax=unclassified Parabacteroides TaxID=2649774 RepID=UPI0024756ECE|nr:MULTISPECIES: HIT family protein [unclassified Parabacteroides]MDH6344085.1 diadenosine tetraphosphate (Ap4A) HIT family hydrolase [Parabacteroides sp. PM6-13]MDH6391842.1 diadenosine tetraphosphate (Ap4A) HIT family hydrolase [Parabacteroides sp. PFB2-12]